MHNSRQEECRKNQLHLIMILRMTVSEPSVQIDSMDKLCSNCGAEK